MAEKTSGAVSSNNKIVDVLRICLSIKKAEISEKILKIEGVSNGLTLKLIDLVGYDGFMAFPVEELLTMVECHSANKAEEEEKIESICDTSATDENPGVVALSRSIVPKPRSSFFVDLKKEILKNFGIVAIFEFSLLSVRGVTNLRDPSFGEQLLNQAIHVLTDVGDLTRKTVKQILESKEKYHLYENSTMSKASNDKKSFSISFMMRIFAPEILIEYFNKGFLPKPTNFEKLFFPPLAQSICFGCVFMPVTEVFKYELIESFCRKINTTSHVNGKQVLPEAIVKQNFNFIKPSNDTYEIDYLSIVKFLERYHIILLLTSVGYKKYKEIVETIYKKGISSSFPVLRTVGYTEVGYDVTNFEKSRVIERMDLLKSLGLTFESATSIVELMKKEFNMSIKMDLGCNNFESVGDVRDFVFSFMVCCLKNNSEWSTLPKLMLRRMLGEMTKPNEGCDWFLSKFKKVEPYVQSDVIVRSEDFKSTDVVEFVSMISDNEEGPKQSSQISLVDDCDVDMGENMVIETDEDCWESGRV